MRPAIECAVKKESQYDLNLVKLGPKTVRFDYELGPDFFALFEQPLVEQGQLHAEVAATRTERLLTLDFHITGTVRLACDRSLDEFDQPLDVEEQLLVRFGDEAKELDDNVLQITPDTQVLPLAQHLYDYIGLALPMKKLHPRFQNEPDDQPDAPTKHIFSTRRDADDSDDDEPADPRWAALRNLN
ncbi:YceD family protein [Hymenobacter caeli]|uniref:Uncharacterized metal-binding protein YceD (DUF177 family) n=1 Tax=Hymenobacter caeli TaxID=2735894 RepID=A0ABX2FV49_9BACT|nr:DUF177 domain-containing protein [Hymenobacter caeli]NRT21083.1 uncharacterized metal-binding protein YceD (DUF177 family) [Hymenobacter caeli]